MFDMPQPNYLKRTDTSFTCRLSVIGRRIKNGFFFQSFELKGCRRGTTMLEFYR